MYYNQNIATTTKERERDLPKKKKILKRQTIIKNFNTKVENCLQQKISTKKFLKVFTIAKVRVPFFQKLKICCFLLFFFILFNILFHILF